MPQQFCKIQSFLLEPRVSYWKVSCIIITKMPPCQHRQRDRRGWSARGVGVGGGSPFSALGRILQECEHDTGEVRASSFVTIHGFDGPLFPSKGNRLHFLGFLARKAS